ncbi:phosphatidate cytidylyltransferase [Pelagibius litoralis]|uniref:Phosphatidate cytidylyltransferase n=1 Tax=Pelagibius litoralis TaxID=374515 RepID=A0A967C1X6_9PROT|nr:phosphatidate cytidylyltransferase [Pelagibius litoralis]NIA67298.1 phosphatidate cytidylyltransferase [Pelagibius litoralis]
MLKTRIISAVVLAPLILAGIYVGGVWLDALMLVAAGLMGWEWARLCSSGRFLPGGILVILTLIGVPFAFALEVSQHAFIELLIGTALVLLVNFFVHRPQALWFAGGTLYIGLAVLSFLWLREIPGQGRALVFWVLAVVWAVDIGAYFTGRGIGGPKLAPTISPNKTWAGLIGGAVFAALVSGIAAEWLEKPLFLMICAGAFLAVVAQGGDLLESWCKRRFGVKDSSHLIPGHGGILDRVDGLLAVLPLVFVFFWVMEARV